MTKHIPVLLQEVVDNLALGPGEILLDGTLGGGGHATRFLEKVPGIRVIALDQDSGAISKFQETTSKQFPNSKLELVNENFRNLDRVLEEIGVSSVDAILLDLGISSDQLDESGRGFTFQKDEPLLMTLSDYISPDDLTAEKAVNTFSEEALELIIRGFGEERYSKRIAKEIVERREQHPFQTTFELRDAIFAAVPDVYKRGRINPATRTFQAIRIAVNEELVALEEGLDKGFQALSSGGRFGIISFHSLEDRVVKNFFRELVKSGRAEFINNPSTGLRAGKPITPTETEIKANPRARSAKLRVIKKI